MNIKFWEVNLPQYHSEVGGYSVLPGKLKENIKLERRAQKYLKELKALQVKPLEFIQSGKFNKVDGEGYFLEIIHTTSQKQRTGITVDNTWNATNITQENREEILYEAFREKLKVEKQDMIFFKWIKSLPVELNFPLLQQSLKHTLENSGTELSRFNIPILRRSSSRKNKTSLNLKQMPSALGTQYNKLMEEKLNFCVNFSDRPLSSWEPKCYEPTYEKYILKLIPAKKLFQPNYNHCRYDYKVSAQSWIVTLPKCDQEFSIMERSYDELFDTHFNKLEFFKIRAKKPKRKKPAKKKMQEIWCLDKEDLKMLVWDPLKKIRNYSWNTIFDNETLNQEVYSIKPMKLKFQKLVSSSLDLIDNQTKTFGTIRLAVGIPNEKTIENTSFKESERNDIALDSTHESNENGYFSSSKMDINTSLAPQKRSFIDNELMSILATKRKFKKHKEDAGGAASISSTSYLMNSGTYSCPRVETPVIEPVFNDRIYSSSDSSSILHSILKDDIKNKCIAVNANKLIENQKVIQSLCKNSQLNLIEQSYFGECDFIINHSTCVYKIQINQFLQLRENGPLYYDKAINNLLTEFHRVIIVAEYPEILQDVDLDLFWKVRFYLLHPRVEVFLIHEDTSLFIDWIKYFITKWASLYENEKEENIANDNVLLDLGFNILLVRKIFQTYTLQDFFIAIIQEESKAIELLTISQITRLKKLLTSEW